MEVVLTHNPRTMALHEALIELGANKTHVKYVIDRVKSTNEPFDRAVKDMGLISPELVAKAMGLVHRYDYFAPQQADTLDFTELDQFLKAKLVGFRIETYRDFMPVGVQNGSLLVAVSAIESMKDARNDLHEFNIIFVFASLQTIQKVYRLYFSDTKSSFFRALKHFRAVDSDDDRQGALETLYCSLLKHGCYYNASDIKMWRSHSAGMIAFKKEGRGELLCTITPDEYDTVLELLKTKTPNSDSLKNEPKESKIDRSTFSPAITKQYPDVFERYVFRVQLYMAPDTEWLSTVIRINDSQSQVTDFSSLEMDEETKFTLRRWINSPTGLVLVTGPTGSGKTSVLYSMLREIDPIERSVSTVENPIEYRNGMWVQKLMDKSNQRTESETARIMLNSLLREAPDVILFGEVRRDKELLDNVMDASNTGHLVLTTLHTKSAAATLLRLLDIGADPKTIASCLLGILAVRLIGILCPKCKTEDGRQEIIEAVNKSKPTVEPEVRQIIYKSKGCSHCNFTGYKGRKMIYEVMNCGRIQSQIEQASFSMKEVERMGLINKSLWERAMILVARGETSFEEAERRVFNPELEI